MTRVLTYRTSSAAPIQAVLDAKGPELALFGKEDMRQILVAALNAGGEYYRGVFIPQLFTGRVMRAPFNYHVSPEYAKRKKALGLPPLVGPNNPAQPRHLIDAAINDSSVEVVSKGSTGKWDIVIHIPGVDHVNFNAMVSDVLRTVPAEWVEAVAEVVAKVLDGLLSSGIASTRKAGPARSLPGDTRQQIGKLTNGGRRGRTATRKVAGHG